MNLIIFLQEEIADSTKPTADLDVEDLYTKYKVCLRILHYAKTTKSLFGA